VVLSTRQSIAHTETANATGRTGELLFRRTSSLSGFAEGSLVAVRRAECTRDPVPRRKHNHINLYVQSQESRPFRCAVACRRRTSAQALISGLDRSFLLPLGAYRATAPTTYRHGAKSSRRIPWRPPGAARDRCRRRDRPRRRYLLIANGRNTRLEQPRESGVRRSVRVSPAERSGLSDRRSDFWEPTGDGKFESDDQKVRALYRSPSGDFATL
jgi:hypothetical protein